MLRGSGSLTRRRSGWRRGGGQSGLLGPGLQAGLGAGRGDGLPLATVRARGAEEGGVAVIMRRLAGDGAEGETDTPPAATVRRAAREALQRDPMEQLQRGGSVGALDDLGAFAGRSGRWHRDLPSGWEPGAGAP